MRPPTNCAGIIQGAKLNRIGCADVGVVESPSQLATSVLTFARHVDCRRNHRKPDECCFDSVRQVPRNVNELPTIVESISRDGRLPPARPALCQASNRPSRACSSHSSPAMVAVSVVQSQSCCDRSLQYTCGRWKRQPNRSLPAADPVSFTIVTS